MIFSLVICIFCTSNLYPCISTLPTIHVFLPWTLPSLYLYLVLCKCLVPCSLVTFNIYSLACPFKYDFFSSKKNSNLTTKAFNKLTRLIFRLICFRIYRRLCSSICPIWKQIFLILCGLILIHFYPFSTLFLHISIIWRINQCLFLKMRTVKFLLANQSANIILN